MQTTGLLLGRLMPPGAFHVFLIPACYMTCNIGLSHSTLAQIVDKATYLKFFVIYQSRLLRLAICYKSDTTILSKSMIFPKEVL